MSVRLWKYYWHLMLILSLMVFVLWMQNSDSVKHYSSDCQAEDCETIPSSFTQPYVPQEISLVSKPYLLMIENNRIEEPTQK